MEKSGLKAKSGEKEHGTQLCRSATGVNWSATQTNK